MAYKTRLFQIAAAICLPTVIAACSDAGSQTTDAVPFGGPLAADLPLAKAYDDAAKAMAESTDNPILKWEYRIWCQTGYRTTREAGTGQPIDLPLNADVDLVSPNGFVHTNLDKPMPAGGVQFMDNAWYFGTNLTGMVVVRLSDGSLVMFDALTNANDMKTQTIDQMKVAGLDPARVTHIFIGHEHGDHYGGVNLVRRDYAPNVKVIATVPAATSIAAARARAEARTYAGTAEEQAGAKAAALLNIPDRIDIQVPAYDGLPMGMQKIQVAADVQVIAMLAPGHTAGQLNVMVPVQHKGTTRKLLIWSGNDNIDVADQYADSTAFVQANTFKEGVDSFINTHAYQGAIFGHLQRLKVDPNAPNPMVMGTENMQRYFSIYSNCHRAQAQRLRDGTWKAL